MSIPHLSDSCASALKTFNCFFLQSHGIHNLPVKYSLNVKSRLQLNSEEFVSTHWNIDAITIEATHSLKNPVLDRPIDTSHYTVTWPNNANSVSCEMTWYYFLDYKQPSPRLRTKPGRDWNSKQFLETDHGLITKIFLFFMCPSWYKCPVKIAKILSK